MPLELANLSSIGHISCLQMIYLMISDIFCFAVAKRYGKYMEIIITKCSRTTGKKWRKRKAQMHKNIISISYASNTTLSRIQFTRRTRFTKRLNNLILIQFLHIILSAAISHIRIYPCS